MDRRSFIRGAGIATVGTAAAALSAPALAQSRTELRLAMPWTRDFPGIGTSAQRLADRIAAMSDGRITVSVHPAGDLVPALQEFDAVSDGRADLYHAPDYYYASHHAALNFFTNAPLGLTATEHTAWIEFGGGQDLWDELSGQFGIKPLLAGNTGTQMAGWFKQPIASLADLQGRTFRTAGLAAQVWGQLGMTVNSIPAAQILPALQAGTLDGADWVGPWNDVVLGIDQVANNYYYPSLLEGCAALTLGVNRGVWDGLSSADQAILRSAAQTENAMVLADYHLNNARSLATIRSEATINVARFPDDVIARIGEVAPTVAQAAATDDIGQRIYQAYFGARDTMRGWTELSEAEFVTARASILG